MCTYVCVCIHMYMYLYYTYMYTAADINIDVDRVCVHMYACDCVTSVSVLSRANSFNHWKHLLGRLPINAS